jgi:hypothetical protein
MMGVKPSSFALGAGTFSACFAIFGSIVGLVQPSPIFKVETIEPFYDWYFPESLNSISLSSRARIVGCLELGAGLYLLSKVFQKQPLEERKAPLGLLSAFFLYSTIGHVTVGDHVIPVATTMLLCSTSALASILLKGDSANLKGE